MVDLRELQPSKVAIFKKACEDKRTSLFYMVLFGNSLQKAMAGLILAAGDKI